MTTVSQLISNIPARTIELELMDDAPIGVRTPAIDENRVFIEPELSEVDTGKYSQEKAPRVILISASAAVGKTTLARYLSRETRNPCWDLSKFLMGSGFFSGTVSNSYGVERYAEVVREIRDGRLCLILDAVDEAIVASTTSNFMAALANLADILKSGAGDTASAVLLGRPETITDTHLYLAELGVESKIYEVSYFSETESKRFVTAQASKAADGLLRELNPFIDQFFAQVKEAFGSDDWHVVGSFLGYAPVLDSLSLFYSRSENPYRELTEFVSNGNHTWRLIGEMLNRVLTRETDKFAKSFGGDNVAKQQFAASAYTLDTQVSWLLADDLESIQAEPILDESVEPEWISDLDQRVRDQFDDHPFLKSQRGDHARNVFLGFTSTAFRDYVLAAHLVNSHTDYTAILRSYWIQPDIVPSMMLSKFVRHAFKGPHVLDEYGFSFISDSHSMQMPDAAELMFVEWQATDDEDLDSIPQCLDVGFDEVNGGSDLQVNLTRDCVSFGRSAAFMAVSVPGGRVQIGSELTQSSLGPRLAIECHAFSAQSVELHVNSSVRKDDDRGGCVVSTETVDGAVRSITGDRADFSLRVRIAPHPWQRFRVDMATDGINREAELLFVGLAIRRIVVWFSRGGMRFSIDKMNSILAKGRASKEVFDLLLDRDLVWIDALFYRMRLDVSLESIRGLNFRDSTFRALVNELAVGLEADR